MRLWVVGGDRRSALLAALARVRGHRVWLWGHGESTPETGAEISADTVALPFPRSEENGLIPAPLSAVPLRACDVCARIPAGARVMAARPGRTLRACMEAKGCAWIDPNADEAFLQRNALATAEGALHALLGRADMCLCGQKCLITGYGRIARLLALRLRSLGMDVTVAARNPADRARAQSDGMRAVPLEAMAGQYFALVNTVPAPIVGESVLAALPSGAMALDVASPPYGIDLDAARALGIDAWREPGLPGRFAPQTAAEAMLRLLEEKEV